MAPRAEREHKTDHGQEKVALEQHAVARVPCTTAQTRRVGKEGEREGVWLSSRENLIFFFFLRKHSARLGTSESPNSRGLEEDFRGDLERDKISVKRVKNAERFVRTFL